MPKSKTKEQFIIEAREKHVDKYDYSKVVYINTDTKIIIICKEHGDFPQTPYKHLKGQGCKLCGIVRTTEKQRDTKDNFIEKAIIKHGDKYNYSKVQYINSNIKVIIICKEHGDFPQQPNNHLQGNGCPDCRLDIMGKWNKSNNNEFISKAIIEHGNRYDYSKVDYKGSNIEVIIICKEHGEFSQQPSVHLSGCGCNTCGYISRSEKQRCSTEEFISKAIIIHGDKYNYSKVQYINSNIKVIIICKEHGEFTQSPSNHLSGCGCNTCGNISRSEKQRCSTEEFISKAIIIHGDKYEYSKVDYINNNTQIIIICKEHSEFTQSPSDHLSGCGCNICGRNNMIKKQRSSTEEFISKAIITHSDKYDYSKVNYITAREKVIIICKKHGEFPQIPDSHLRGVGCPDCKPNYSKKQIKWLNFISILHNIIIQHVENGGEFIIPTTKYKADGYCKDINTIYEFHGDLWHGNPKIFNPEIISFFGIKYGDLYQKTLKREQIIRDLGYNLVVIWEYDWNRLNKSIKILQKKFRSNR